MLKKKVQDELNKQMNREIYSAYLYLSMAAYFDSISLKGFANWMKVQAQEEMVHALKFYDYIVQKGGRVLLSSIAGPAVTWKTPLAVFDNVRKHEAKVTGFINELVNLSIKEKDHATNNILQWFVNEQVEEESSADEVYQKVKLVGNDKSGLFMMDAELGTRVFTPPVPAADKKG